jgi:hypothetical protein
MLQPVCQSKPHVCSLEHTHSHKAAKRVVYGRKILDVVIDGNLIDGATRDNARMQVVLLLRCCPGLSRASRASRNTPSHVACLEPLQQTRHFGVITTQVPRWVGTPPLPHTCTCTHTHARAHTHTHTPCSQVRRAAQERIIGSHRCWGSCALPCALIQ